jgi:EAL and modified HD-GYP domain-containing signal transduction protein
MRQAIVLLGLNRLRNLVTVLVLDNNDPCNMLLLPQALTRATMCSQLVARDCKKNKEPAFMVGLLSMADVLLGQKLEHCVTDSPSLPVSSKHCSLMKARLARLFI